MNFTKFQLKLLRRLAIGREKPPTFWGDVKSIVFSKSYVLYAILLGYSAFLWWFGLPEMAYLLFGVLCGYVLKDIALIRINVKLWPLNLEIIDWKKVDELIQEFERLLAAGERGR